MSPLNTKSVIEFLSNYGTCDMADALLKFGHKHCGVLPNLNRYSRNNEEKTMVGKAYTVLFAPKDDPREAIEGGYIDELTEDSILVIGTTKNLQKIDAPFTKLSNALNGGLMSTRANYLGSNGTVVFGRIRDLNEHQALQRDVFAYGLSSVAHAPAVKLVGINVPIEIVIDGYPEPYTRTIIPGDYIMGDDNGIVSVADNEQLPELLKYIPKRVEADDNVRKDIAEGKECAPAQKARRGAINMD